MRAASPDRQVTLGASPTFHMPDFSDLADGVVASPEHEARLETTYYDTVDLRLARWGVSLSHHDRRWTLAIPNGAGPGESALSFEGGPRRPPAGALTLVRAYLRGAALEPVARLSSWRRRVPLTDGSGHQLAEVIDVELSDDRLAWELDPEGEWHRVPTRVGVDAQERFRALAHEQAREQDARRLA